MAEDSLTISQLSGLPSYEDSKNIRTPKNELGRNDFLALLAAQMQYQDPLSPMEDTAFIAQLAQFSALQQMEALTTIMTTYQYFSLVGKFVYAEVRMADGRQTAVSGIVDRVIMQDGKAWAQIGEYMIDCERITEVLDKDLFAGNKALLENTNLIGKYLQALTPDETGKETVTVAGICTRVAVVTKKDELGSVVENYLAVYLDQGDGKEITVPLGSVFDIAANAPDASGTGEPEPGGEPGPGTGEPDPGSGPPDP
ncbi:MAG: hypothetical protein FWG32_08430 [Oscillospiraceae bacterium]|nr:hypothetical protein [Oscillospiraceae bacterium]